MEYDRVERFPFDFEPNGIPFGSKSEGKLSPRSYPIQCEKNWKYSFLNKDEFMEYFLYECSEIIEVLWHSGDPKNEHSDLSDPCWCCV